MTAEVQRLHSDGDPPPVTASADSDRLSVLGALRARREAVVAETTLDLKVPRWTDPEIIVRFRPVDHKIIRRALTMSEKAVDRKKSEIEVNANCDILISGCVAVFARLDEADTEYSLRPGEPTGEPTTFDEDLAQNLGCEASARSVVKALYITDGDILSTASKITEFSGYREQEADEDLAGE